MLKKMITEFRQFITRGNVIDMAVGIVIGGAFLKIVTSLVNDVITPPLGLLLARVDFRTLSATISEGKDGKPVLLPYGSFLSSILDFLIVGFVIFLLVKAVNKLQNLRKKEEAAKEPATRPCPQCLMEIPVKALKCGHCTSAVA